MALSPNFGAISGIACPACSSMPPRNAADFLELAKNCAFLDRKLISAFYETTDGQQVGCVGL